MKYLASITLAIALLVLSGFGGINTVAAAPLSAESSAYVDVLSESPDTMFVWYYGTGYNPGERVSTWYQDPSQLDGSGAHNLPHVYADKSGEINFPVTVSSSTGYGEYRITAVGPESGNITGAAFVFGEPDRDDSDNGSGGSISLEPWQAAFWNNMTLSGAPVTSRTDSEINFDWGTNSPAAGVNADHFSARWTTTAHTESGNYTFTVTTDDGMRVWVDGTLIIDVWYDQSATTHSATVFMGAGNHRITVEYYENGVDAVAIVAIAPA